MAKVHLLVNDRGPHIVDVACAKRGVVTAAVKSDPGAVTYKRCIVAFSDAINAHGLLFRVLRHAAVVAAYQRDPDLAAARERFRVTAERDA